MPQTRIGTPARAAAEGNHHESLYTWIFHLSRTEVEVFNPVDCLQFTESICKCKFPSDANDSLHSRVLLHKFDQLTSDFSGAVSYLIFLQFQALKLLFCGLFRTQILVSFVCS